VTGAVVAPGPAESAIAPVLSAAPGGERKRETVVASAPKVQVIKEVKIFFYYPPAQKVAVTGDFNDWNADGVPLKAAGKPGLWETELRLPPGVYSYNFIVDGELLVPDPNSPNQMPDGYGGTNSLLLVKREGSI
jgi:1,4-alpha-glucan branching enzyme